VVNCTWHAGHQRADPNIVDLNKSQGEIFIITALAAWGFHRAISFVDAGESMIAKKLSFFVLFAFAVLALSACGPGGFRSATPTPLSPLVNFEKAVFPVERGSIISLKDLVGEIVPSRQDELFFRSSGFTTRVTVKSGDTIKKGDVIAELQIDDLLNQLQQAQIDLEVAQANQAKYEAQRTFDIAKSEADVVIWQKRLALAQIDLDASFGAAKDKAQLNYDITEQNLKTAEESLKLVIEDNNPYMAQSVKRAELAVQRMEALLRERQIVAPYDAVVLRASIRPGQQVEAYFVAFVIGDPTELVVRSPINYDLTTIINKDSEVKLYFSKEAETSYPLAFLPGFLPVSQAEANGGRNTSSRGGDFFYFGLPEDIPQEEIKVGRQVSLTLLLGKKDDVLLLPPAAIREYRGLYFVIIQEGDRRRRVEINQVGLKTPERWEVTADLSEGDKVLGP
jgi:multidrug efflux pump subunit AcrA (membrane-fusion protein)